MFWQSFWVDYHLDLLSPEQKRKFFECVDYAKERRRREMNGHPETTKECRKGEDSMLPKKKKLVKNWSVLLKIFLKKALRPGILQFLFARMSMAMKLHPLSMKTALIK